MKFKSLFFILLLLSFFSLNKLPVNISYLMALPFVFLSFYCARVQDLFSFLLILFSFLFLIVFSIGLFEFSIVHDGLFIKTSGLFVYSMIFGAAVVQVGLKLNDKERASVYSSVYSLFILMMIIDLILRFTILVVDDWYFYAYKNSFFYYDSNFSAVVISVLLMFSIYANRQGVYNVGRLKSSILVFLLVMTFSRAAIISFLLVYLMLSIPRKFRVLFILIFVILGLYIVVDLLVQYMSGDSFRAIDGSFNSKFMLMNMAIDHYQQLSLTNKIFGIGMSNFEALTGRFAHNILITFAFELGFVGVVLFLALVFVILYIVGFNSLYILLFISIVGFSLFSSYMPFVYAFLSCIYIEEKSNVRGKIWF